MSPALNRAAIALAAIGMVVLVGLDALDIFKAPGFVWSPADWSVADWIGTGAHLFAMVFSLGAILACMIFLKQRRHGRAWGAVVAGYLVWPVALLTMTLVLMATGAPQGI